MQNTRLYALPTLPFDYSALAPIYLAGPADPALYEASPGIVNGANTFFAKFDKARKEKTDLDIKATAKELSFHIGGNRLHTLFLQNLAPAGREGKELLPANSDGRSMQISGDLTGSNPGFRLLPQAWRVRAGQP